MQTLIKDNMAHGMTEAEAIVKAKEQMAAAQAAGKPPPGGAAAAKERDANTLATEAFKKAYGRDPTSADEPQMAKLRITARQDENGVISDEAATLAADRVLAGDESALLGMARSAANITKVNDILVSEAKKRGLTAMDISLKVAEFKGLMSAERTLGTREANMEVAANVVRQMAPQALAASEKVDRTQFPTLNSIIIAAERGSGDENVVRLGMAANALIYEYAKFLNPTGIPTDADKARATDMLNTKWTQGQFKAAIDQILHMELPAGPAGIAGTHQELREQFGGQRTPTTPPPAPSPAPTATPTAAPTGAGNISTVQSKAAYDALPPGSWYRKPTDPPGSHRVKQ